MITTPKRVYKNVSEENALPQDLVESIGNVIFQHLRSSLNNPQALAYEVPEIGSWNIRFNRFERFFYSIAKGLEENNPLTLKHVEDNPGEIERNTLIIDKINSYRKDKKEVKEKRNEQNQAFQSSENHIKEH